MSDQNKKTGGYIGVDLDGTLAHYDKWVSVYFIGPPIIPMVNRVKEWLRKGKRVKIFTARVSRKYHEDPNMRTEGEVAEQVIKNWCLQHVGEELEVTCIKDFDMYEYWDDRAVQVKVNTGEPLDEKRK
jgi:hypothetical protein